MFYLRFHENAPSRRSVEQLRGMEGTRVRGIYKMLARQYGVSWNGRNYDPTAWDESDMPNKCISAATACLYGVCEAGILAAGYAPAIGFVHTGKPLSFVYDIADLFKFETVVPLAFRIAARHPREPDREVRHACRDMFRKTKLLRRIIPAIESVLAAGGIEPPKEEGVVGPAFEEEKGDGDDGHRG